MKESFPKISQPQSSLMMMKQGVQTSKKDIKEEITERLLAKKV